MPMQPLPDYRPKGHRLSAALTVGIAALAIAGVSGVTGLLQSESNPPANAAKEKSAAATESPAKAPETMAANDGNGDAANAMAPAPSPAQKQEPAPDPSALATDPGSTHAKPSGQDKEEKIAQPKEKAKPVTSVASARGHERDATQPAPQAEKSNTDAGETQQYASAPEKAPVTCGNCGSVESIEPLKTPDQTTLDSKSDSQLVGAPDESSGANESSDSGGQSATSYRIRIRMADGRMQVIYQNATPSVATGTPVKILNGEIVPLI